MISKPLELLIETASANHASLLGRSENWAEFGVNPPLPSGAPSSEYHIRISASGMHVSAREIAPTRLPSFCPDRHINQDGTFCLYWEEAEPLDIVNHETALEWWVKLIPFLRRQEIAGMLRRWPGQSDARAHGPEAARFQAKAEQLAFKLGDHFTQRLNANRFRTEHKRRVNEQRILLKLDGRRLVTVVEPFRRVMTLRQICKCDAGVKQKRILRACGDHAQVLADFVLALHGWHREEQKFYERIKQKKLRCCGTMDNCALAA